MRHVSFEIVCDGDNTMEFEFWGGYIGNGKAVHALSDTNRPLCGLSNRYAFRFHQPHINCKKCLAKLEGYKRRDARNWQEG